MQVCNPLKVTIHEYLVDKKMLLKKKQKEMQRQADNHRRKKKKGTKCVKTHI